jgi:hypothetical protein
MLVFVIILNINISLIVKVQLIYDVKVLLAYKRVSPICLVKLPIRKHCLNFILQV